jgi:hypothetical protein
MASSTSGPTRGLIRLSSRDPDLVRDPREVTRLASAGAALLAATVLAAIAAYMFLLNTVGAGQLVAFGGAVYFGWLVFWADRMIIARHSGGGILGRLLLSVVVGVILTHAVTSYVFRDDLRPVMVELADDQAQTLMDDNADVDRLAQVDEEVANLQEQLQATQARVDEAHEAVEAAGAAGDEGTTMLAVGAWQQATAELQGLRTTLQPRIDTLLLEKTEIDERLQGRLDLVPEVDDVHGVILEVRAMLELVRRDGGALVALIGFSLLFLAIDLAPLLMSAGATKNSESDAMHAKARGVRDGLDLPTHLTAPYADRGPRTEGTAARNVTRIALVALVAGLATVAWSAWYGDDAPQEDATTGSSAPVVVTPTSVEPVSVAGAGLGEVALAAAQGSPPVCADLAASTALRRLPAAFDMVTTSPEVAQAVAAEAAADLRAAAGGFGDTGTGVASAADALDAFAAAETITDTHVAGVVDTLTAVDGAVEDLCDLV